MCTLSRALESKRLLGGGDNSAGSGLDTSSECAGGRQSSSVLLLEDSRRYDGVGWQEQL